MASPFQIGCAPPFSLCLKSDRLLGLHPRLQIFHRYAALLGFALDWYLCVFAPLREIFVLLFEFLAVALWKESE